MSPSSPVQGAWDGLWIANCKQGLNFAIITTECVCVCVCVCAATKIQKQIKWDTQGPDQAHNYSRWKSACYYQPK